MEKFVYHIGFEKKGLMRFISHLDLLRLFQRAARRANLPLSLSEGFNPHPKIRIEPALKLGIESSSLKVYLCLKERLEGPAVKRMLEKELPQGIRLDSMEVE